jgi:hypothetical protein
MPKDRSKAPHSKNFVGVLCIADADERAARAITHGSKCAIAQAIQKDTGETSVHISYSESNSVGDECHAVTREASEVEYPNILMLCPNSHLITCEGCFATNFPEPVHNPELPLVLQIAQPRPLPKCPKCMQPFTGHVKVHLP